MRAITMAMAGVLISAVAAFAAKPAAADSIVLTLNTDFGGGGASGSPTATFDDHGSSGSVDLLMSLTGLSGPNEFVTEWFFNSTVDPSAFTFTYVGGSSTGPAATSILKTAFNSSSSYKADGVGGYHDIEFDFPTPNASRFNAGEYVKYTITGAGITAHTFDVGGIPSGGSSAMYESAVHLQGLGQTGGPSTWLGSGPGITTLTHAPEPATLALLGLGMAGFAARRRMKRGGQSS